MKYDSLKKELILNKEINNLDRFVLSFVDLLDKYVIVSGYVSILLGRSRATEDIDLLIPNMVYEKFEKLWESIKKAGFECINTSKVKEAFDMWDDHAIRFCRKGKVIPNMEFKKITNENHKYSFDNKIKVIVGKDIFLIAPLEMQIAYKLYLGSQKDLEDAKHLYDAFLEDLNINETSKWIEKFKVGKGFEIIKWKT